MKAWFVGDGECGILLHAATRGKAKVDGSLEMGIDFLGIFAWRFQEFDDKPFTKDKIISSGIFKDDETGRNYGEIWMNSCTCEMCEKVKNDSE